MHVATTPVLYIAEFICYDFVFVLLCAYLQNDDKKICKFGGMLGYTYKAVRKGDSRESGKYMQVTLNKKYESTVLAVSWRTNILVSGHAKAARWYITIDGHECTSPDKMAMVMYQQKQNGVHMPSYLTGYCKMTASGAIRKGRHVIAAHIGKVAGHGVGGTHTGWSTPSILQVKEICPPF